MTSVQPQQRAPQRPLTPQLPPHDERHAPDGGPAAAKAPPPAPAAAVAQYGEAFGMPCAIPDGGRPEHYCASSDAAAHCHFNGGGSGMSTDDLASAISDAFTTRFVPETLACACHNTFLGILNARCWQRAATSCRPRSGAACCACAMRVMSCALPVGWCTALQLFAAPAVPCSPRCFAWESPPAGASVQLCQ